MAAARGPSTHTNAYAARSYAVARRIGEDVAAAWADCRYANARMIQIRLGPVETLRRRA